MRAIAILVSILAQSAGFAADATLAQVNRVSGLVRIAHRGSTDQAQATAGMVLVEGDLITTISGRIEIKFAGGHLIRLTENATLEVMAPVQGRRKGVFTRLVGGKMRALVARLSADETFEMRSSYAIASVKGTDAYFDGLIGSVRDEGDGDQHSMQISSSDGQTNLLIGEGMSGGFTSDGGIIQPGPGGSEFFTNFDLPGGSGGSSGGASGGGSTGGGATGGSTGGSGGDSSGSQNGGQDGSAGGGDANGGDQGERDELRGDLSDFVDSQDLGKETDTMEHSTDIALGRSLVDMHGFRVRLEEHVNRTGANQETIEIVTLTSREAGPNAGISSFIDRLTFNRALPDNYEDVRRGLPAAFRDSSVMPDWYPVSDTQTSRNPAGDQVRRQLLFEAPAPVFSDAVAAPEGSPFTRTYMNESIPAGWGQKTDLQVYVGVTRDGLLQESLREHFMWDKYGTLLGGWYSGCSPAFVYPAYSPNSGMQTMYWSGGPSDWNGAPLYPIESAMYMDDPSTPGVNEANPILNNPQFGPGTRTVFANALGGVTTEANYDGQGGSFLRTSSFLVSDEGNVLGAGASALTASSEQLGHVNELIWEASDFAGTGGAGPRTIDAMVSPGLFDENGWATTRMRGGDINPGQPQ